MVVNGKATVRGDHPQTDNTYDLTEQLKKKGNKLLWPFTKNWINCWRINSRNIGDQETAKRTMLLMPGVIDFSY